MATSHLNRLLPHLHRAVLGRDGAGLTDEQLLEGFLDRQDEAAFEALVRRHGPMVLGVCRRVLGNSHDAEDAYQSTFLVLVRKAAAITPRARVGHWLYGVAHRTALKAKAVAAKRHARERPVAVLPDLVATPGNGWHDFRSLLDQELSRLPEKYRLPIVLCGLEGRSHQEAARLLGWPPGTLSVRLARARTMLAGRLARQGVVVSSGLLTAFCRQAASAQVPPALVASTVRAGMLRTASHGMAAGMISAHVVALTEGVVKAMMWTRVQVVTAVVLAIAVVGTGAGWLAHRALAGPVGSDQAQAVSEKRSPQQRPMAEAAKAKPQLLFRCQVVEVGEDGQERRLAEPTLMALEGRPVRFFSGSEVAVETDAGSGQVGVAFEPVGVQLEVSGESLPDGLVHLQARLEFVEADKVVRGKAVRIPGRFVRAAESVRRGGRLRLVLEDDQGRVRHRADIQVEQVPNR